MLLLLLQCLLCQQVFLRTKARQYVAVLGL